MSISIEAPPTFARYALFVSFFPQLIAGRILRGQEFLPQLTASARITTEKNRRGIWLIASGLPKKVILGDFLFAPLVEPIFADPGITSGPLHLLAIYAFAFQIYFDFSGYTDMARGIARLLGFEFPKNFEEPHLSRNPTEFWRRWQITPSRWLRDYLYIPLGGNRGGSFRSGSNLLITILMGGLWHGAGWNFLLWGGMHGVLLGLLLVLVIAASGRGGEFLDLHRTLPDRAFRDSRDHINFRDSADPTARMAKPMLDWLLRRGRSVDLPSDPS